MSGLIGEVLTGKWFALYGVSFAASGSSAAGTGTSVLLLLLELRKSTAGNLLGFMAVLCGSSGNGR